MFADRIIDADGCRVIINDTDLRIRNRLYRLKQVNGYGIGVHKPDRLRGLVMTLSGMMVMCFVSNIVFFWIGALVTAAGITSIIIARQKYSMRISTPLGDKDVLTSKRKENIYRVIQAMDEVRWLKIVRETKSM